MAHATRPAPSLRFHATLLGCLAAGFWIPGAAAQAGSAGLPAHMQMVAQVEFDPETVRLPSVQLEPIRSSIPLNDRFDADAVFDLPFTRALHDGLAWYLSTCGVRVVEQDADVRLAAAVEGYEGWRRLGRWGVGVSLRARLYHENRVVVTESVQALLRYPSPLAAVADARQRYQEQGMEPSPEEVLFARVGVELGSRVLAMLKKHANVAVPAVAVSTDPGLTLVRRTLERGVITIEANVEHAEVLLDGQLVGTTPLVDLNLSAGSHVLEVRREGYQPWKRQIHVIERAASRFYAEMAEAPAAGSGGS